MLSDKFEVAHIAGTQIFGQAGARIASGLICVGLVANVSGMMWVGSRVTEAIGTTYPALGLLGKTSATRVPYVALIYQFFIVFALLFFKPDNIVNYVGSVLLFWSLLAVIGVIVLRFREPNLLRPYRTWGYPLTPIIFALITFFCLVQNSQIHLKGNLDRRRHGPDRHPDLPLGQPQCSRRATPRRNAAGKFRVKSLRFL